MSESEMRVIFVRKVSGARFWKNFSPLLNKGTHLSLSLSRLRAQ